MLEMLVEAALRSLALTAAVWLILRLPCLKDRQTQLIVWRIVLAASLLMSFATRLTAQISFVKDTQGKVVQLVKHEHGEDQVLRRFDRTGCPSGAMPDRCPR
jgi:hypothetical protein